MRHAATAIAAALLAGCATVPPAAAPAGEPASTYWALGTEPFWSLVLNGREMVFTEANAPGVEIRQPQPRPIIGFAGEIYRTPRISLNIVHAKCSDGMSDRVYPDKVQVDVDGRRFEGCGGLPRPVSAQVQGQWSVLSVGGLDVAGKGHAMTFGGGQVSARFGCNRMSGSYRAQDESLSVGPLAATRMACPDMRAETAASAILARPLRVTWTRDLDMVLQSDAGEIRLREVR